MPARPVIAVLLSVTSILTAGTTSAQPAPADVTFEVPLNLTRIHDSIPDVRIACTIESQGLRPSLVSGISERIRTAAVVIAVNQGNVVQNAQLVFPLTHEDFEDNASGRQATYECKLFARTPGGQWAGFVDPRFNPVRAMTPVPAAITGAFVW